MFLELGNKARYKLYNSRMKIKYIVFLIIIFSLMNIITFAYTRANLESRIEYVLGRDLDNLTTHYKILSEAQKNIAFAIQSAILRTTEAEELLESSFNATKDIQAKNRAKLLHQLEEQYETAKKQGVLQIQFIFKDNDVFLRVQKPEKFGDNLTGVRSDYEYTHKYQKPIRMFAQGTMAHGFRNVFPMFNKSGDYIGAMEVSFSSESYQWYLDQVSHIHSHFIVNKNIFEAKSSQSKELILTYENSSEHEDFLISLSAEHSNESCIINNLVRLKSVKEEMYLKMSQYKPFATYVEHEGKIFTISLYPIENIGSKNLAWIVAYKENSLIQSVAANTKFARFVIFFISLLIIFFLIREIRTKQELIEKNEDINRQHNLLNEILNTTPDIMFITDFKDVKFSNNKFREFFNVKSNDEFNENTEHNFINTFLPSDGYLSSKLLKDSDSLKTLIERTPQKDKIVSILDVKGLPHTFTISASKSKNSGDYLVSLSDITKIKEHQEETEKIANYDSLTNIYNRQKFDEIFKQEIKNSNRYSFALSLAILDIDKFKLFNDTYGHLIGDEVLISTTQVVQNNLRDTDLFARWGGEEFVLLFRNTKISEAKVVVNKLRVLIEKNSHPLAGRVTASFGLTQYKENDTIESMFKRCDEALYMAKANGRNRVEIKK